MFSIKYEKPDNLVDVFENSVGRFGDKPLLGMRGDSGKYHWVTYAETAKRVDDLRGGLSALGVNEGDTVGFIGVNSLEWLVGAYATYGRGAIWVPMYEAELESLWKYIIEDATIKVLIVASEKVYDVVKSWPKKVSTLSRVIKTYGDDDDTLAALEKKGSQAPVQSRHPESDKVATLIYTSGTTGDPKGVLLTHGNLSSNIKAGCRRVRGIDPSKRALSILPWAHSYAQTAELHNFIQLGASIGLAKNVTTIVEDIQEVKPTHLIAVPRVFNKLYHSIHAQLNEKGGLAKRLFEAGVSSAARKRELNRQGKSSWLLNLAVKAADKVFFKKVRDKLGGRLEVALTASATMDEEIAYFFYDLGVPVLDCYGLTETSPAVTMNSIDSIKFGTVGKPLERVVVDIDKTMGDPERGDGEIVVYGPNVMAGYHKKTEATAEVMTKDGGFRTGDLGYLDEDGYLVITGRIKEQYKLANGKYVFPGGIEGALKLMPEIANALIYGDGREYNVCLLVPNFEALGDWVKKKGLPSDPDELVKSEKLRTYLEAKCRDMLSGRYGKYEIPKKFAFIAEDFSVDNGMLTQTLKLKRRVVLKKFGDEIEKLYEK